MSSGNGKSGEITLAVETRPAPRVEPDNPPTRRLFLQIAALSLVLVGVIVGLVQFFKATTTREIYRKELAVPNRELLELEARDEGRLTQYAAIDEAKGVYQIPIRRAMQMIADDPSMLASLKVPR